jgi:hypothetical protein
MRVNESRHTCVPVTALPKPTCSSGCGSGIRSFNQPSKLHVCITVSVGGVPMLTNTFIEAAAAAAAHSHTA